MSQSLKPTLRFRWSQSKNSTRRGDLGERQVLAQFNPIETGNDGQVVGPYMACLQQCHEDQQGREVWIDVPVVEG